MEYSKSVDSDLKEITGQAPAGDVREEDFSLKVYEAANFLGMGATSQAVRELTSEVKAMAEELMPAIEAVVNNINCELKSLDKRYKIS